jgi:hypothetical protein
VQTLGSGPGSARPPRFLSAGTLTWVFLSTVYAVICVQRSVDRALWLDELFTLYVAQSEDVSTLLTRLLAGMDNHPPVSYLLVHGCIQLFGSTELACRLPSIVVFWLGLLHLHRTVASRSGAVWGLLAVSTVVASPALAFAVEARGYALLFYTSAAAFHFWAANPNGRSRIRGAALLVALTVGVWSHYYGAFTILSLALGEAVRWRRNPGSGRANRLALGAAALNLPLVYLYARQVSGDLIATFWARPGSLFSVLETYQRLTGTAVLVIAIFVVVSLARQTATDVPATRADGLDRAERTAAGALVLVVPAMWLLASLATHAFHYKYALHSLVGWAMVFGFGLQRLPGFDRRMAIGCAASLFVLAGQLGDQNVGGAQRPSIRVLKELCALASALGNEHPGLPVVFQSPFEYMGCYQYSTEPLLRSQMRLLVGQGPGVHAGSETIERALFRLARFRSLSSITFDELGTVDRFLLLWNTQLTNERLAGFLAENPRTLQLVSWYGSGAGLYLASRP